MPHEQLLALAMLAFVGCFTPGPNNMIATVPGANHGFRAALPHVLGMPFGFASMLIAGAAGVAALWLSYPFIAALIKWAGIAVSAFHCVAACATTPECDTEGLESYRLQASFVLAVRCPSVRQSESMDALRLPPDRSW